MIWHRQPHALAGRAMATAAAWAAVVLAPALSSQSPELPQPMLTSSLAGSEHAVSTDGTLDLSWRIGNADPDAAEGGITFELEEIWNGSEATLIDAGPYFAAALSGRDDGHYRYRVRMVPENDSAGPWSEPIEVRVRHHPLALAFAVFAIGAIVFIATACLVLLGHRGQAANNP